MAPKQKKAPAKKSKGAEAAGSGQAAECALTRAPFEEESWQVCLSMVVGNGPGEEDLSRCLLSAVQQPIRAHFTPLTWDGVLEKLCEFNPKAKKVETLPPFYQHAAVAEAAKGLLDAGQPIPSDLLAKVVKCLLLQVKRVDQQRRQSEQCSASKAEEDGVDTEKTEKKSKLKRRGEVEIPTILDQPEDGPQLFVLLFGFYCPLLVAALDDVGVHVSTVLRLCSEDSGEEARSGEHDGGSQTAETNVDLARKLTLFWSELGHVLNSGSAKSRLPDVVQLSYTVPIHSQEAKLETGIRIYGGVANLLYDCLAKRRQHQHYLKSIRLINVPAVARLPPPPAEVVPATTPRSKKKGEIVEPPPKPKIEQPFLSADVDTRYYWNLMDRIPPESCSVPLILHCMLEQVVVSIEEPSSSSIEEPPPGPPERPRLDDPVISFFLQRFLPQARSSEERYSIQEHLLPGLNAVARKRLAQTLKAKTAQRRSHQPLLIRHHDETARRLMDITASEDFDPAQVEQAMTRLHPACSWIQFRGERGESAPCWRGIRQHLQYFCTDEAVPWRKVERFFHQSVFESMPLTRLNRDGVLERSSTLLGALEPAQQHTVLPWDDPPFFANLQLKSKPTQGQMFVTEDPDNAEIRCGTCPRLELADIRSCRLRCLSDFCFSEHHDAAVFSQVLQTVWDQFCCVDVFTGRLNNMVYMFCHTPTGPNRHSTEVWDVGLHTDIRFRNYLEHVAETISDWTREEELKREAAKAQRIGPAEHPQDLQAQSEEKPVVREGSLKAWKLEQEQLKKKKEEEEEEEKTKKTRNEPKGKQEAKPAGAKKGSSSSAAQKKGAANVEKVPEPPVEDSKEPHPGELTFSLTPTPPSRSGIAAPPPDMRPCVQAFIGLSTGGMLIRLSGRVQHLRPSDGGVVTVEDIRYAEGFQLLKVVVEKDGHRFCTHVHHSAAKQVKRESPEQPSHESLLRGGGKQGSFTARLRSGAQMSYSFYGPTGEAPGDVLGASDHLPSRTPQAPPSSETPRPPESQEFQKQQTFRSLSLSVPSGLLVQFQPEVAEGASGQQQGLSVKQCFPLCGAEAAAQLPDLFLSEETFRTISSAGEVIRHLRDGGTQVLFADGTVSFSSFSGPDSEVGKRNEEPAQTTAQKRSWITMTPGGERFHTVGNTHERLPVTDLLVVKATDPLTNDVMLTREDWVVLVQKSDGSQAVEHADGTRITSWYQDRPADVAAQADRPEETTRTLTSDPQGDEGEPTPTGRGRVPGRGSEEDASGPADDGKAGSNRERVVSVEKDGCATVVMFPERRAAQVVLADGTVVTGTSQGTYEVCLANAGRLEINSGGTCVYVPVRPAGGAPPEAAVYRMSHTASVACDITDPEGNHFQVMANGDWSVRLGSSGQEEKPHQEDLPRLFLVHGDGSAVEFLSSQTVEELLHQAHSDPAAALLKEPLPDCPDEFGITVLKPGHRSLWSQWRMGKQAPDITPQNLRNRSWADLPQTEKKTPGPQFGTNFEQGTSGGSRSQHQSIRTTPEVLEIRQLYEHRPLSAVLADEVDARLKDYMEALMSRERQLEEVEVVEPPAEQEIPAFSRTTSDLLALYKRRPGAPAAPNLLADASSRDSAADRKSRWMERLRRYRQELREEKALRAALRTRSCVPYFHPENLPLYQDRVQPSQPDLRRASALPPPVQTSDSDLLLPETPPPPPPTSPPPPPPPPPQTVSRAAGSDSKVERSLSDVATQTAAGGALKLPSRHYKSFYVDVIGEPRKTKVRLPASVVSSSVRSEPNQKFLSVEGPVRRSCGFTFLSGSQVPPRGFQLVPSRVDFGSLPDGGSASVTVRMKNVGVDCCRFHIKQPPVRTGVRVLYTPGPVPAGLHVDLQVQLLARAAVEAEDPQTRIRHDLVIQTELETLYLPVTANILKGQSDPQCVRVFAGSFLPSSHPSSSRGPEET